MKVAILSCFYPYRGGIAQFNASFHSELGKTCTVKAFNFSRQYPDFLFPGKTQYVSAQDEAVPVESEALLDTVNPFTWFKTARRIREWDPDVLVMRYWMPFFAPCLGFVARRMKPGCKVIGILDNVIPHERHFWDTPLTKYFLKALDGGITLCKEVGEDLARLRPSVIRTVLPHPVYTHFGGALPHDEACRALGLDPGLRTLLFFGLIREYKGLDILLEAFRTLPDGYQLLVAGEPYGSFDRYQKIIDSLPDPSRVHLFPEYVPDSKVGLYFSASDVVVLPYRSATQSGVSSAAYHFGVPMIVTDVGGLKEAISERGTGIVVPAPEPGLIAQAISEYFSDPALREKFSAGIEAEKERLGWAEFCKDFVIFAQKIEK